MSLRKSRTTFKALSIPLFNAIGWAPWNSIALNPLSTSSFDIKVLVVVPSPANKFVLFATLFTSLIPISIALSSLKIDLTTVTPSFVILGPPFSYSRTTFLPPGPNVRQAAYDTLLMPWIRGKRDSCPNLGLTVLNVGTNFIIF